MYVVPGLDFLCILSAYKREALYPSLLHWGLVRGHHWRCCCLLLLSSHSLDRSSLCPETSLLHTGSPLSPWARSLQPFPAQFSFVSRCIVMIHSRLHRAGEGWPRWLVRTRDEASFTQWSQHCPPSLHSVSFTLPFPKTQLGKIYIIKL